MHKTNANTFFDIIKEKIYILTKPIPFMQTNPRNDHETAQQMTNDSLKRKLEQSIEWFSFLSIYKKKKIRQK